jgi:hypothetical protein
VTPNPVAGALPLMPVARRSMCMSCMSSLAEPDTRHCAACASARDRARGGAVQKLALPDNLGDLAGLSDADLAGYLERSGNC